MRNLYSKKYCMKNLIGSVHKMKTMSLLLILCVVLFSYALAGTRIYYSPSNIYPILNVTSVSNTGILKVDSNGQSVWGYWADVHNQSLYSWEQFPNNQLTVITNIYKPTVPWMTVQKRWWTQSRNISWTRIYGVREFAWTSDSGTVALSTQDAWALFVTNSWSYYLTSAYINFFTSGNHTTYISGNLYDSLSGLNIYFRACPATKDTIAPVFPNNQTWYNTNINFPKKQINRQYKDDFSWVFSLLDNTGTTSSNGWIATPDFDAGSGFRPNATNWANSSITNQNGINTWSFVLQIKIATGWNHTTVQASRNTRWTQHMFTGSSSAVMLTGRGKTWRYRDKNFTGQINTGSISDFGIEELVMISGYVADRDMSVSGFNTGMTWNETKWFSYRTWNLNTNFVYYFNQGMRPWFNSATQWTFTHNSACTLDLDRNQTGVMIRTITWYLHDDRAGINTGTIQIIVTGSILGAPQTMTYTISSVANLSLSGFGFTGSWCRIDITTDTSACTAVASGSCGNTNNTYPGNGTGEVCNTGSIASTWNYRFVFSDIARTYDPENGVAVSIVYQDLKGKQWRPVYCDWWVKKAPRFVWTGLIVDSNQFSNLFSGLIVLSNYPNGAQILPINIQLQDDWQGVNVSTISWSIAGKTLDTPLTVADESIDLAYAPIYTQKSWADLWLTGTYPNVVWWSLLSTLNTLVSSTYYRSRTGWVINSIPNFQLLNYEFLFGQTWVNSTFTWYFAPEHPIIFNLTFSDNGKYLSIPVSNSITNVTYTNDEAPMFREYIKTGAWTWGSSLKLLWGSDATGNYLTWEMAKLFSGGWTTGQRIFPYDLTWDTVSQIGTIKQTDMAFQATDNRAGVDSGSITVTVSWKRWWSGYTYVFTASKLGLTAFNRWDTWLRNQLNYFVALTGHGIYFDRQSRGGNAPVVWRESRYTITLSENDLKKPTANTKVISFTRDMENLSCQYLNRCNARLYFTYDYNTWAWIVPVVQTWVHPFEWQTLYVIASGSQVIYTGAGNDYIACNGAGSLAAPINIVSFDSNYQYSTLTVMDGTFQLNGNVLVLN